MVQAAEGETCVGVPIEVRLHAAAPDGGAVLYQLTELPRLGTAQIEGDVLTYTPGEKRGTDRFFLLRWWTRRAARRSLRRSSSAWTKTAPA